MSANAKDEMRQNCLKEGFDGFTAKPFTYEEILKLYRLTVAEVENANTNFGVADAGENESVHSYHTDVSNG
jgi:CheY-like chemotaxis protein